jgi:hypothetical protein
MLSPCLRGRQNLKQFVGGMAAAILMTVLATNIRQEQCRRCRESQIAEFSGV